MNAPADLRLPPHSIEAEQSLIGGLLLDNSAWDRIVGLVADSDFYRDDHRRIFRHQRLLLDAGRLADVVTVFESIERANEVDQTGGLAYLGQIANATPSAANIRRYAEIVHERATLRRLINAGDEFAEACFNPGKRTPADLVAELERRLAEQMDSGASDAVSAASAMSDALSAADERQRSGRAPGLDTGVAGLDRLTGGLLSGQLVVVAARPSVGKTAFALSIADRVADGDGRVAFFSLEMTRGEIANRLLAMRAGVPMHALRSGPDELEWGRLAHAVSGGAGERIAIIDRQAASVSFVRACCRRLARQGGLSLVVVDYLQLMTPADPRASRNDQVGSLSRGLKALAKEVGVPIICLAQLNRAVESRADRRPQLSDLRDSGEIEQDSDLVALMARTGEPSESENAVIEVRVAKHRNGPTGDFALTFDGGRMRFEPYNGPRAIAPARQARRGFDE